MLSEDTEMLDSNYYRKCDKATSFICADFKTFIKIVDACEITTY